MHRFCALAPAAYVLIWKIEEPLEEMLARIPPLLLATESALPRITAPERLRQSVAVRLALAHLLDRLGVPLTPLGRQGSGKPMLTGHPNLHLSFAHTPHLAAAAASMDCPIGIDLERIQGKLVRVQEKVLAPQERKHARNSLDKLSIYWCAKEALYKCLGAPPKATWQEGVLEPFELASEGTVVMRWRGCAYEIHYQRVTHDLPETAPHTMAYVRDLAGTRAPACNEF